MLVVNGVVVPAACIVGAVLVAGTAGGVRSVLLGVLLAVLAAVQLAIAWRPVLRIDPDGVFVRNVVRRRRLSHGDVEAVRAAPTGDGVEGWLAEHPRARWRVVVELADGSSLPAVATERGRAEHEQLQQRLGAVAATYGIHLATGVRQEAEVGASPGAALAVRRGSADRIYYGVVTPVLATGLVVAYWVWWGVPWGFEVLIPLAALAYAAGTLLPELRIAPTGVTVRNAVGWSRSFGFNEVEALSCCRLRHASNNSDRSSPGLKIRLVGGEEIEVNATRRLGTEHRKLADEVEEVLASYQVPLERGDCCPGALR